MLREEELSGSPDDQLCHILNPDKRNSQRTSGREFSFIQNRVPSPLNNNFLLSEEQSRHIRQPSEGFMTAAHNLMNQDEFRFGLADQDQIEEEDMDEENDDLNGSKITLFTHDGGEGEEQKQQLMTINTVHNTESNGDDFNYSESNYQYIASSSLGAIIQANQGGGSFIGNQNFYNGIHIPNLNSRSSNPQRAYQNTSGRESATPFNYDENSLMNLSQTPTSNMIMVRGSNPSQYQLLSKERIGSSTKINHNQNSMVQILEDARHEEDEQDESMIKPSTSSYIQSQDKQQDVWPSGLGNKKYNPLEMPLQRKPNPFSPPKWNGEPLQNDNQVLSVKMDTLTRDQIFGRCKTEEVEEGGLAFPFETLQALNQLHQHEILNTMDPLDGGNTEDEIQMIKRKLDFSRLSSLQNLSQHQTYLNCGNLNSFLFQTYQSLSNKSLYGDPQQMSTCNLLLPQHTQLMTQPSQKHLESIRGTTSQLSTNSIQCIQAPQRKDIPFQELLKDHIISLSRNNEDQRMCKTYFTRDQNGLESKQGLIEEFQDRSSIGTIQQEPGINPPSLSNTNATNLRPPMQTQRNGTQAEKAAFQYHYENKLSAVQSQRDTPTPGIEMISKNQMQVLDAEGNRNVQYHNKQEHAHNILYLGTVNIYQNNLQTQQFQEQQFPFSNPPSASRQVSNKVYSQTQNPIINYPLQQPKQPQQKQSLDRNQSQTQVNYTLQTKKVKCQPLSDTPREPSSMMIEENIQNISGNHLHQKLNKIQHQILQNHQQLGGYVMVPSSIPSDQVSQQNSDSYKYSQDDYLLSQSEEDEIKDKAKLKKKTGSKPKRLGSKQRNGQQLTKQKTVVSSSTGNMNAFPNNFMSKTMIISKDRINTAVASQKQSVVELPVKQESLSFQNQIQFVQKYKQQQLKQKKSAKVISQAQTQCLNSGRSLPTSSQSSAQTSFLTVNAQVKKLAQKTTSKKVIPTSKESSTMDEKQIKKLKKKTKSIVRQQLQSTQQVQSVGPTLSQTKQVISIPCAQPLAQQQMTQQNHQTQQEKIVLEKKCNTQRSLSRPKSGFGQEQPITIQPGNIKFGKKKNSVIVMTAPHSTHNSNKENIRPGSSAGGQQVHSAAQLPFKKPLNLVGHQLSNRPEELLQSFENIKLMNGQDLLKEIHNQQQRMSNKNFQHLFSTIDHSVDIGKRAKTEGDNHPHAQVMKSLDSALVPELDPYNMLLTLDSQRTKKRPSLHKNTEVYNSINQPVKDHIQHNSVVQKGEHQNLMPKMQSPYNSKTMKNKFSSIKSKKHVLGETSSLAQLMTAKGLSNCSSVEQIHHNDDETNKKYNELIHLLKHTRFLAR